jgi:hypothetical protein
VYPGDKKGGCFVSTVISNGYRLAPDIDIFDLCRNLDTILSGVRYQLAVRATGDLIHRIVPHFDNKEAMLTALSFAYEGLPESKMSSYVYSSDPYTVARVALADMQEVLGSGGAAVYRSPSFDLTFSIAFYQNPHQKDQVFARVFAEQKEYIEAWESIEGVEEFFYWDNTDHPDHVTRKQWKERSKMWDAIMGESGRSTAHLMWKLDTFCLNWLKFDDEDIDNAVAEAALRHAADVEWYNRVFGKESNSDDTDSGGIPLPR